MSIRILLLGALIACAPTSVSAQQAPAPFSFFPSEIEYGVTDGLLAVLNEFDMTQAEDRFRAIPLVVQAAYAGRSEDRPLLRDIVARAKVDWHFGGVVAPALHALWELGEPEAYFYGILADWNADVETTRSDPVDPYTGQYATMARYAFAVLARNPTPALQAHADSLVAGGPTFNGVNFRSGTVGYARGEIARYQALTDPAERIDYALRRIGVPLVVEDVDRLFYDVPTSLALRWLRELAQEHPEIVEPGIDAFVADRQIAAEQGECCGRIDGWKPHLWELARFNLREFAKPTVYEQILAHQVARCDGDGAAEPDCERDLE